MCAVRCDALFEEFIWLFGCSISRSNPNRHRRCTFALPGPAAFIFSANVSVQVRRLVRRNLQRIVRNFIMAVRLFHSHSQIMASASPLHLCFASSRSVHFQCERRRSPSAHLVRRKVERLVGSHYSSAVPGLVPNIVPAPSVTFVSQLWRVHCACGRHIYSGANVSVHPRATCGA